jgi:hypothetical protein
MVYAGRIHHSQRLCRLNRLHSKKNGKSNNSQTERDSSQKNIKGIDEIIPFGGEQDNIKGIDEASKMDIRVMGTRQNTDIDSQETISDET